jgi:hypothetical protein
MVVDGALMFVVFPPDVVAARAAGVDAADAAAIAGPDDAEGGATGVGLLATAAIEPVEPFDGDPPAPVEADATSCRRRSHPLAYFAEVGRLRMIAAYLSRRS